ncbi:SMI1/KNR4 family protein [Streptomyces sp. NPDC012508]|uniref:SMI1/KNR4 family protein n=1 Tax=Streptomyces sp. NPDC012508 TaxID=3364837 RepID=UPI0036CAC843
MLGAPQARPRDPRAWAALEASICGSLPSDFKDLIDAYAPIQLNGHLYLMHPATERWNLGEYVRSTADAWSEIEWDEAELEGDPRLSLKTPELTFGAADGLIPIASTDRGETLFYAPRGGGGRGTFFVEDGEGEFFEYACSFSEWLYRYLVGEEMAGPGTGAFYPGPVSLRDLPMTPGEDPPARFGPPRGM